MENNRRKPAPIVWLLILIVLVGVIFSISTRSSHSTSIAAASDHIAVDDVRIELHSPTITHYALQESEFILSITSDKDVELINPSIKLEMLHMDCGIVSSKLSATSLASYSVSAAPLMKGVWVATASFQLEDHEDDVLQLHYTFEVL